MDRTTVIEHLERSERPYQGWMNDYPDLAAEYFAKLSPLQQIIVNELNSHPEWDLFAMTGVKREEHH